MELGAIRTMNKDLFHKTANTKDEDWDGIDLNAPLAWRMRPETLDEYIGQTHILGADKLLRRFIQADRLSSVVFYGPPGTGKTTLAQLISKQTNAAFQSVNAVSSNTREMRSILTEADLRKGTSGRRTILFIDEIHRFNKAQQDILMPAVEKGTIILVGATTHNPFFSINSPLLSRSLVLELKPLTDENLVQILERALGDNIKGMGKISVVVEDDALALIARQAGGDARRALNALEIGVLSTRPDTAGTVHFNKSVVAESMQKKLVFYDRDEDYHYDTISAFIKSMRGSDPDASIYWLAKMLYAGEEASFITRRLVILAAEDIGNADPRALMLATSAAQAVERIGLPEARLILAQTVIYLAMAPKSNASMTALDRATADIQEENVQEVPNHLRDGHYKGAEKLGHGKGYKYAHNYPGNYVVQQYMPRDKEYYQPADSGFEKNIGERIRYLRSLKKKSDGDKPPPDGI